MRKKIGRLIIFINLVFISDQVVFSGPDENKKILSEMEKSLQELLEIMVSFDYRLLIWGILK